MIDTCPEATAATPVPRQVRSFVRRAGRTTPAQRRALAKLLPRYALPGDRPLDAHASFGRHAPLTLEIGFGNGDSLLTMARAAPERDFIGIEVYDAGIGRLLESVDREALRNLRVWHADAVPVIADCVPEESLDEVLLFFPDPWPKKRHHKRRIVQPDFARLIRTRLRPGGVWRLATDWAPYAEHMLDVLEAEPGLLNMHGRRGTAPRPTARRRTRFEDRGARLGHDVTDLEFQRRTTTPDTTRASARE